MALEIGCWATESKGGVTHDWLTLSPCREEQHLGVALDIQLFTDPPSEARGAVDLSEFILGHLWVTAHCVFHVQLGPGWLENLAHFTLWVDKGHVPVVLLLDGHSFDNRAED